MNPFSAIAHGFFSLFGYILAYLYDGINNLATDIAILTVIVLVPFTPLIARSVVKMSQQAEIMRRLAPEIKRIKETYKDDRVRQSQEINMLLSKENFSLTGGCLPLLPQMGVLFLFYAFIRGIFHAVKIKGHIYSAPLYLPHSSSLYHALKVTNGRLSAFGMVMAAHIPAPSFHDANWVPYWMVAIVGGLFSFIQMQRSLGRMPQNPQINQAQQQAINRLMPILFMWFYFILPIAVGVYYATSAIVRFFQYEYVYWRHPELTAEKRAAAVVDAKATAVALSPNGNGQKAQKAQASSRRKAGRKRKGK